MILTGKLAGRDATMGRITLGAVFCGAGGFSVFMSLPAVWDALFRIVVLAAAVFSAFGRRCFLKITGIFMVLTFLSGGIVMALLLWRQETAVTHQGIVYIDFITYSKLLCFGILAFGFSYWFVKIATERKSEVNLRGTVRIIVEGREYALEGFIDSGNTLTEPLSGKPVVLIDLRGRKKLDSFSAFSKERIAAVPFKTIGRENGYLKALRTDILVFGKREFYGVYVAFYEGYFEDYEVLLSRDFLKGGLVENA